MGRKRTPGLYKRGQVWHIDKYIHGQRVRESTGTGNLQEAEEYLARKCELLRQFTVFGVRPDRTFREAATKYLLEHQHKASFVDEARTAKLLDEYIGNVPLQHIHMDRLKQFIDARLCSGVKRRTVNSGLQLVRQILNTAAYEWRDEKGLTWLQTPAKIKLLPETDKRDPYPLNWKEQDILFQELPSHLAEIALFAVNTGCREQEMCKLRWEWEVELPELNTYVFVIPGSERKNGEAHVVVLNKVAKSIVTSLRGKNPEYVFTYKEKPLTRINNSAWKKARVRAGLPNVRVHDLRHTFGRRLRAAGVSYEDRQDLLGHKSYRITTHYSSAEINNLIKAAEKACEREHSPTLMLVSDRKVA